MRAWLSLVLKTVSLTSRDRSLSYFYDRIAPLGLESPFKMSDLRQLTTDVCAGPKGSAWSRFKSSKEAMDELDDRPEYCLDLSFLYSLLSFGYELAEDREIIVRSYTSPCADQG